MRYDDRSIYLENYTSVLCCSAETLERFYEREITVCDRAFVESDGVDGMLKRAEEKGMAFLVVRTVCSDDARGLSCERTKNVKVKTYYNASICEQFGGSGLQLYNFGKTVSLCFFTKTWKPDSFTIRLR